MENYNKGGNGRKSTDARRDYGRRTTGSEARTQNGERQRRPRISKPSGERMFSSSDERQQYPRTGERRRISSTGERRNFTGEKRSSSEFGERRNSGFRKGPGAGRGFGNGQSGNGRPGQRKNSFGARKQVRNAAPQSESGINRMIDRRNALLQSELSDNDFVHMPVKEEMRLNKFISNSGICSRREADNYILAGVVTVNGKVVTELGTKININDDIRFNGERLKGEEKVYIVMNKPKGYVTTTTDPHAEKTVMDLLKGCPSRVFSVGRLDKNTTGVLMFTNDGEMAEKLTHPSYNKKKIYQVTLDNKLKQEDYDKILQGVVLSDGEIAADELEYIDENDHRKIGIEIHSGKNRIVRRIFESLGYEVKALDRVYFAGLTKKNLKKGHWRYLSQGEVNILKMGAYR